MFAQAEMAIRELFEQALVEPEQANLNQVWQNVEPVPRQMSKIDQLRLGGWATAQLADLHHQRAMRWLSDWEETDVEAEPLIAEDWLNELIQQTMHLDLSELTRQPKPCQRKRSSQEVAEAPIAGEGEKDGSMACVDPDDEFIQVQEMLAHPQGSALLCAHDEDVSAWIEVISRELRGWVEPSALKVTFSQLCQRLQRHDPQMTLVKVWISRSLSTF